MDIALNLRIRDLRRYRAAASSIAAILLAISLALIIGAARAAYADWSLRYLGYWSLTLAALAVAFARPQWARTGLRVFGAGLGMLTLLAAIWIGQRPDIFYNGSVNVIAAALLLTLPFQRGVWLGVAIFALIGTQSRAAWLGLIAAFALLIGDSYRREVRLPVWPAVLIPAGLAVIVAVLIAWRPSTVLVRLALWRKAWLMIVHRPVWGHGLASFGLYPAPDYVLAMMPRNDELPLFWHAHNLLLQAWAETGILGLLAWAALYVAVFKLSLDHPGTPARLALCAFLISQLADFEIVFLIVALPFGACLGLLTRHVEEARA
jgi:O-antigen ligase